MLLVRLVKISDVYKGIYLGLGHPDSRSVDQQCSIVIKNASARDNGVWTCKIYIKGNVLLAHKNVVVTGNIL